MLSFFKTHLLCFHGPPFYPPSLNSNLGPSEFLRFLECDIFQSFSFSLNSFLIHFSLKQSFKSSLTEYNTLNFVIIVRE